MKRNRITNIICYKHYKDIEKLCKTKCYYAFPIGTEYKESLKEMSTVLEKGPGHTTVVIQSLSDLVQLNKLRVSEEREEYMTINDLISNTKDTKDIYVAIKDKGKDDYEVYFGDIPNIPEELLNCTVLDRSTIGTSSDKKRIGANVLVIDSRKLVLLDNELNLDVAVLGMEEEKILNLCGEITKDIKERLYQIAKENSIDLNTLWLMFEYKVKEIKEDIKQEYIRNR